MSAAEARKLATEGRPWCGLTAACTRAALGAQQLMETLYQFVSAKEGETRRILDDVIILFVHANRTAWTSVSIGICARRPEKRSLSGLPRLYRNTSATTTTATSTPARKPRRGT